MLDAALWARPPCSARRTAPPTKSRSSPSPLRI